MGKLDGKVALITGASEGIGFTTAEQFLAEGAEHVFITGRRQEKLDEAVKKLGGKNVTGVQGDTASLTDLNKLYAVIKKETGRLDVLFANAGIAQSTPLESVTEKQFDDLINVNVKGVLFTVQKALPLLVDGASIILNGSGASIKAAPARNVYGATKAAIRSFARCWTVDLKERKIRVNTLSPGVIDTPMAKGFMKSSAENSEHIAKVLAATPLGRVGTSDEIAKAVVFLASDDSSYVTGIELFVDGGVAQI
ncbi:unnamed protein product [Didymodactylos carnosus]|uniref:Dehydrogenase/reductase SDR family member 6 n=2 Tax=Didymodactylos carnosus TaxID=1234261 RepID=A0A8S2P754_9BILA|nr:unnamed protein product [Didymodactylos carnosus]CAF4034374.1 unnamed protein product [Didymodactylos carnosus]